MKIPVVTIHSVVHVGDKGLSPRKETPATGSQEGPLLSVSVTPRAWCMIAKRGGGEWMCAPVSDN